MAISAKNRLVEKAAGASVEAPRLAKDELRRDLNKVLEWTTNTPVGQKKVLSEPLEVPVEGSDSPIIVQLSAMNGLYPQATLIVHNTSIISVDLSNNPTEIAQEDAMAAREVLDYLIAKHAPEET